MLPAISAVNDNHITHSLYDGKADHFPFVPAARYLIGRYINAYWKHDCNDLDFIDMELTLCNYIATIDDNQIWRNLNVKWIARALGVSPLKLHNDPDLPF